MHARPCSVTPIGARTLPEPTTRRDTAVAGKIPVPPMAPALSGTRLVRGTILRITDLPVPIREHQSGGTPIHAAPTRRAHPHQARPPPGE
jgi:hypothetical protein